LLENLQFETITTVEKNGMKLLGLDAVRPPQYQVYGILKNLDLFKNCTLTKTAYLQRLQKFGIGINMKMYRKRRVTLLI
jgi:hypothetical protein